MWSLHHCTLFKSFQNNDVILVLNKKKKLYILILTVITVWKVFNDYTRLITKRVKVTLIGESFKKNYWKLGIPMSTSLLDQHDIDKLLLLDYNL